MTFPSPCSGSHAARSAGRALALALLVLLVFAGAPPGGRANPSSADPDERVAERVEALLGQMTLDEKVGQLTLMSHGPGFDIEAVRRGRVGALINFNNARDIATAQRAVRESRLAVPLLFGLDVLHGFRTTFPVPLGETATFDPALARFATEWRAREAAYVGVQWTFAPMVDIARDPRWGRIVEGVGRGSFLGRPPRVAARARFQGFRAGGLATAPKHFAGYGAAEGGRDYDATEHPDRPSCATSTCRRSAPPSRPGGLVMSAFNALDGVPATANRWLLTDVLRTRVGLRRLRHLGLGGDRRAPRPRRRGGRGRGGPQGDRGRRRHGPDGRFLRPATSPARSGSGRVREATLDAAVRRVLRAKVRLGLFERADADPAHVDAVFLPRNPAQAALRVARETLVLLREPGRGAAARGRHPPARGGRRARRQPPGPARPARGPRSRRGHADRGRAAAPAQRGGRDRADATRPAATPTAPRGTTWAPRSRRRAARTRIVAVLGECAGDLGRGGLARAPRPAGQPGGAARGADGDGQAGDPGADRRPAARARARGRPARGRADGLVPRHRRRRRDRRDPVPETSTRAASCPSPSRAPSASCRSTTTGCRAGARTCRASATR